MGCACRGGGGGPRAIPHFKPAPAVSRQTTIRTASARPSVVSPPVARPSVVRPSPNVRLALPIAPQNVRPPPVVAPPVVAPRPVVTQPSQQKRFLAVNGVRRRGWVIHRPVFNVTASGLPIIDPSIWGAPLWKALHTVAELTDRPTVLDLWKSIPSALDISLPCPDCESHYHQWLTSRPAPMEGKEAIRGWLLDLHNVVNQQRKLSTWNVQQIVNTYNGSAESIAAASAALVTIDGKVGSTVIEFLRAALAAAAEVVPSA